MEIFPERILKLIEAHCNSRLGSSPKGTILIIENEWADGIKQDGKAEAPWILIATASREAKKEHVTVEGYHLEHLLFSI